MSVSISPRCSRRCAHRGGGGAGDEIEGMCCFFVHHSVFPPPVCVPSPTPLLISEEKGGECNQDMREWWGGGLRNCLQGNKRMVDWQRVQPSFSTFCRVCPAPPHPSPLSHLYLSEVLLVEISEVHRRDPLAAPTISRYPSPQWTLEIEPTQQNHVCKALPTFSVFSKAQRSSLNLFNLQPIF